MNPENEFTPEIILGSGELFIEFCDFVVWYLKRHLPNADLKRAIRVAKEINKLSDRFGDDAVKCVMNSFFNAQIRIVRDHVAAGCEKVRKNQ